MNSMGGHWSRPGNAPGLVDRARDHRVVQPQPVRNASIWGMKARVLVVDDDPALAEMLTIVLRGEGFDTAVVGDGARAMPALREFKPDLVLLDLMLPGMNGIDVCKAIRGESGVPVVMLTAKSDTVDIVLGLESGADDYVVKPVQPRVLDARIRAVLRRQGNGVPDAGDTAVFGDLVVDRAAMTVTRGGIPISLTPTELKLLVELSRRPGQALSRQQLLRLVWDHDYLGDSRLVDACVQRLRAKVEVVPSDPRLIRTVRGIGYRLDPPR